MKQIIFSRKMFSKENIGNILSVILSINISKAFIKNILGFNAKY